MNIYSLIPIVFIILSLGYWFYTKSKISQQVQTVDTLAARRFRRRPCLALSASE